MNLNAPSGLAVLDHTKTASQRVFPYHCSIDRDIGFRFVLVPYCLSDLAVPVAGEDERTDFPILVLIARYKFDSDIICISILSRTWRHALYFERGEALFRGRLVQEGRIRRDLRTLYPSFEEAEDRFSITGTCLPSWFVQWPPIWRPPELRPDPLQIPTDPAPPELEIAVEDEENADDEFLNNWY